MDQRRVIRNSAELVRFGRDHMTTPKRDYYSKRGTGVYRRWTHHIPVRGRGAIQRRRVKVHTPNPTTTNNNNRNNNIIITHHRHHHQTAKTEITTREGAFKVAIRTIRRVVSQGYAGLLFASKRPCCRKECSACSPNEPHISPRFAP